MKSQMLKLQKAHLLLNHSKESSVLMSSEVKQYASERNNRFFELIQRLIHHQCKQKDV